ncbi:MULTISPECIES: tetratricopeptide repeat protein [Clostridia]|uniref:tetratricopeptide repeat protein n=1 Tax=Clostridia TaxID=186801 RepID=UPI000EA0AFE1|nr:MULTISPECIES: tetratricopeptide repeat protein [Clostridia]NBJ68169.1 tetratricopeptide repeat protein [Roseburia sp. 1XD42-34]RKI81942.1 tetratricopeptide repeat protein [Clostridium sp. 1xD42-85]
MSKAQINPKLIRLLTHTSRADIPDSPTRSWLPGKYAMTVYKQRDQVKRKFPENHLMLTCNSCGRKGKYDVGMMVINPELDNMTDNIQTTGYFRCKHCNEAGDWTLPNEFYLRSTWGLIAENMDGDFPMESICTVGENRLYDGSKHIFTSDAEAHLLNLLEKDPSDAYIWNRLGNIYDKGGRPELAVSVLEHSIGLDIYQTESYYTLANLLFEITEYEEAASYFRKALVTACEYDKLDAKSLRDALAVCLEKLFYLYQHSDGKISFVPTDEEREATSTSVPTPNKEFYYLDTEIEVFPGDPQSFYPFAEMYMGKMANRIPKRDRAWERPNVKKRIKAKKRHKRTKRK